MQTLIIELNSFQKYQSIGMLPKSASEDNEFKALRMSILKSLSTARFVKGGQSVLTKTLCVDMPCSRNLFVHNFVCSVPHIDYSGENSYKCRVMPSDLNNVFGENWHIFQYAKSCTRRRIIGLVSIHFRMKTVKMCQNVQAIR